jgi:hypothetical protein
MSSHQKYRPEAATEEADVIEREETPLTVPDRIKSLSKTPGRTRRIGNDRVNVSMDVEVDLQAKTRDYRCVSEDDRQGRPSRVM